MAAIFVIAITAISFTGLNTVFASLSRSYILDIPTFTDEQPKSPDDRYLDIEWLWLCGELTSDHGKIQFIVSLANYGCFFSVRYSGATYKWFFDISKVSLNNGVLTIGGATYPRIVFNLNNPHTWNISINQNESFNITQIYRGVPLWYGKTTLQSDMLPLDASSWVGGFDALSNITATYHNSQTRKTINFSGYGVYEHAWVIGSPGESIWLPFWSNEWWGIVVFTFNTQNGQVYLQTGRLCNSQNVYRLDDFVLAQGSLRGNYTSIDGLTVEGELVLTFKKSFVFNGYIIGKFTGIVGLTSFDGAGWIWAVINSPPNFLHKRA